MQDEDNLIPAAPKRTAWNKGKLIEQSPLCGQSMSGRSGPSCRSRDAPGTWRFSI
jgi:hypothetical protein